MLEDEWIYVVEEGDTVDEIAAKTGRPVGELIWANQLEYPYRLAVGQSLYVGAEGSIGAGSPLLYSFGYAYPFIDRDTLDETLPFLTDIYIFSYGFTAEGESGLSSYRGYAGHPVRPDCGRPSGDGTHASGPGRAV